MQPSEAEPAMPTVRIELADGLALELNDEQRQRLLQLLSAHAVTSPPASDAMLTEDHPMWDHASGGDRQAGIEFHADDEQLARNLRRGLSTKASVFFEHLLREPGRLVSTSELIEAYPDVFGSPSAVAGSLTSFSRACKRAERSLPFYWWEGSANSPTRYAIRPAVAQVFLRAGS
jgi:hypothetical protein